MISEIYFDATRGDAERSKLVVNMIFHEWLHNRLDAGMHVIQDVHNTPNGVLTTGGAISLRMSPNTVEVAAMRRGLNSSIAQYASW